jgi:Kef-type K+ transport system membrane component KefB
MESLFHQKLPFDNPVLGMSIVLFIIFLAPLIFRKLRIPGIVGLILAGVAIGQHGFNVVSPTIGLPTFSTIGLLYLMFLAGLDIDLRNFKTNKNKSLLFGAFTFFVPLALGLVITYYVLKFEFVPALLLSSVFSTHTLLSYPIALRLNITRNEAVNVAVGGTIITDTAVLLLLTFIASSTTGDLNLDFWVRMGVSLSMFLFILLIVIPKVSKWVFTNIANESNTQYIYVFFIVFFSSLLALAAGIEAIIGAFLAGLALNRLIPHSSALMNRIVFIGNTIFIPMFLINVGMLVDLKVFFAGLNALILSAWLVGIAISSKWLAAFFTQKILKYSVTERNVIFGLSNSHAAATIAVIMVGYQLKLFDEDVLNAIILLILITCLVSSFVTEYSGRKLAIWEMRHSKIAESNTERILVPIANPANVEQLIKFSILAKDPKSENPINPLMVLPDEVDVSKKIIENNRILQHALKAASADHNFLPVTRVDINIADGIVRAIKELAITKIIVGWSGKVTTTNLLFGTMLDNLLYKTEQMIMVVRLTNPAHNIRRIFVIIPENAEYEIGFQYWLTTVLNITRQAGAKLTFACKEQTVISVKQELNQLKSLFIADFEILDDFLSANPIIEKSRQNDLIVFISARKRSISYHSAVDNMPNYMLNHFGNNNFVIIYPRQREMDFNTLSEGLEGLNNTPIPAKIESIGKLGNYIKRAIIGGTDELPTCPLPKEKANDN